MRERPNQFAREPCQGTTKHETIYARRNFLVRAIATMQMAIGGTLAFVVGGSILSPSFARRQENWFLAGTLSDLVDEEPVPVAIRVAREDGHAQIIDRQIVFLVRTGASSVVALSSVCTHLGCRVSWNRDAQALHCPCHGGVYDRNGDVKAGPPPAPLTKLPIKVDGERILVQI